MSNRLSGPLGSYADHDEFQIGRTLVWVKYPPGMDRQACLRKAEAILPTLEADVANVEKLAACVVDSSVPATVLGITIEADGSASYTCTFSEGEYEDEFISIKRNTNGVLSSTKS